MHVQLPSIRRARIAERLNGGSPVIAASLAAEFGVSEDAIRRDLRALAGEGRCTRTYGGALPLSPASAPMIERMAADAGRKRALALAAASLIQPGQLLFLDSGSTNLALAAVLPELPGLTVATNSVPIAAELLRLPKVTTLMIGGSVDPEVGGCVDGRAVAEVRNLGLDQCFIGACALSRADGIAAFHYPDAVFKRELLRRSRSVAAIVTTEKIETRAPHGVAGLDEIRHLVLEHDAPSDLQALCGAATPDIVVAAPPH